MKTSTLERGFLTYWKMLAKGYPEPEREHRFAPPRKYRFDFAWVLGKDWSVVYTGEPIKIAVELQGGIWTQGRHSRGYGMIADYDKHNLAVTLGWKVFYFTRDHFKNPSVPIKMVMEALKQ